MKSLLQTIKWRSRLVRAAILGRPIASNVEVFGELHATRPHAVIERVHINVPG